MCLLPPIKDGTSANTSAQPASGDQDMKMSDSTNKGSEGPGFEVWFPRNGQVWEENASGLEVDQDGVANNSIDLDETQEEVNPCASGDGNVDNYLMPTRDMADIFSASHTGALEPI